MSIIGGNFNGHVILHWYSGSLQNIETAIEYGYFFSVNYAMVKSSKGNKIIKRIPIDKILLESDGPFIKMHNKIYQPRDMKEIITELAKQKNLTISELKKITYNNFRRIQCVGSPI